MGDNALVSISGVIKSVEAGAENSKMRLCEGDACATVTFRNSKYSPYLFGEGANASVTGFVRSYRGAKLVSANEIRGG